MSSLKKSKFKSLTTNENANDFNEISNQLYEVKIFSNFETKNDHFSPIKVQEPRQNFTYTNANPNAMEIEPEPQRPEPQQIEPQPQPQPQPQMMVPEPDVFKQQEEKLFKRNDLKVKTTNLTNQFQQEYMEINSEAKVPKKKSKEGDMIVHDFRHLIFSPHCSELVFKRHLTIIYRGLIYAKKCLKGPSENYLKSKQIDLVSRIANFSKSVSFFKSHVLFFRKRPKPRL